MPVMYIGRIPTILSKKLSHVPLTPIDSPSLSRTSLSKISKNYAKSLALYRWSNLITWTEFAFQNSESFIFSYSRISWVWAKCFELIFGYFIFKYSRHFLVVGCLFQLNLFYLSLVPSSTNAPKSSEVAKFSKFSRFISISFDVISLKFK